MNKYFLVGFLAVLLVVSGCQQQTESSNNKDGDGNVQENTNNKVTDSNDNTNTGTTANEVIIKMTARKFEFEPSSIRAKKGDKIKLLITSEDVRHGFKLPDFNINEDIEPGKTTTVEFTADKTGTFTFACSVFCGSGHTEMDGKLIVE